jgi:hypothetical protein
VIALASPAARRRACASAPARRAGNTALILAVGYAGISRMHDWWQLTVFWAD